LSTSSDAESSYAATIAAAIHSQRSAILDHWLDLIEFDRSDPAFAFVHHQLDATLLALAGWLVGEQPESSRMASLWSQIRPGPEMVAGASVALGLLPEVVRGTIGEQSGFAPALRAVMPAIAAFSRLVIHRILESIHLDVSDERWDEIAHEVEARYERQRVERTQRLGVLIDIAHAVSTVENIDSLFEHIHTVTTRINTSDYTSIALLDDRRGDLVDHLVVYRGERRRDLEGRRVAGLAAQVVATGKPISVTHYGEACAQHGFSIEDPFEHDAQRGWMAAPMIQGSQVIGVVAVSCPFASFERDDVELLSALARQTAVAFENRRLIDTQRRHVKQLRAVNQLARQIVSVRDPDQLLSTAVSLIHELFGYSLVSLFLADANGEQVILHARSPIPAPSNGGAMRIVIGGRGIVGSVSQHRTPVVVADVHEAEDYLATEETRSTRAEMAVPIVRDGELLGVLDVQSPMPHAFNDSDITTLHTIADQIAIAMENARLFHAEAERSEDLSLILSTTRAAGSSLHLDEVLEQLARGIAQASAIETCLICLLDESGRYLSPAVLVDPAGEAAEMYREWNHLAPVSQFTEIEQAVATAEPVLYCPLRRVRSGWSTTDAFTIVPLALKHRVLGVAITSIPSEQCHLTDERLGLIRGIADSAALAIENARLYARSHGLAIAEERGRLAQEIHDTLAQGLTAISLQLDLADSYLPGKPEHATGHVQRALDLTRQNLDEARRSVLDLQAGHVHRMALPEAINHLLQRLSDQSDIEYELVNDGLTSRMSARVEIGLYRIVEEALENARKHSGASNVCVRLSAREGMVSVIVEDDGRGFDQSLDAHASLNGAGFGLVGIRERARLLGGSLILTSGPENGATVQVTVPYEGQPRVTVGQPEYQGGDA
jgi:two-component system, NarL family, sensor kinase